MHRIVRRLTLLITAAKDAAQEIIHRHILLLCAKNRLSVACGAAHTNIFFTSSAGANLHDVHDRLIASAFFTKHDGNPFPLAPV